MYKIGDMDNARMIHYRQLSCRVRPVAIIHIG